MNNRNEIRYQQREIKSNNNHIEQEIKRLEFQKNKLLGKIKTLASSGNHAAAKPLAKQVTQINSQLAKLQQFSGKMTAINYKVGNAASLEHVSNAMQAAGNAMQMTNQRLDANKIKDLSKNMQKQNMKLEMNSDMMDNALDFMDDDIENDEEANDIYNQVMREAGYNAQKVMPGANRTNINSEKNNYNKVNNGPYVNPFGNNPYQ
jgi:DNA repair ATPase RecN